MIASRRLASLPLLLAGLAALAWMPRALRPHAGPGALPSARPAPFQRAVSFALLALGGALLWSAPAEAQTATVLVSNTGQTSLMTPWALNSTIPKRAQAFTTGAHTAGYTVSSIGISFAGISDPSTAGDQLIVTLNANGNGNPGDALCTLGDPASFTGSGVHTFAAPATCPTLTASTTYFAVIERVVSTATISLDLAFNLTRIHRRTGMDGVRTAEGGEGVTGAMIRARTWVDGRLASGLQALLGAPMAAYSGCGEPDGGIGHGKRRSRTGLARVCGDVGLAGGSVADGRRQAGSGMARSRARARLNCSSQGQRRGRCRVNRRAERVIRPTKAKTRRLRVLVVTIC